MFDTSLKLRLPPRDLHLVQASEEIVEYEDPLEWDLNPLEYLLVSA